MNEKHLCANCDGTGWVCEDHPEVPWLDGEGCCGGAGSPCVCNPCGGEDEPPRDPPGFIEIERLH